MTPNGCKVAIIGLLACVMGPTAMAQTSTPQTSEQSSPYTALPWSPGPMLGLIGNQAKIQIPEGYGFLSQSSIKRFIEMNQNIPDGSEQGALAPWNDEESWFLLFSFEDIGYVKDDEGKSLDAEKLLQSFQEGTRQANEERRKRGWPTMEVDGWSTNPYYEAVGHHLEWGLLGHSVESDGSQMVVVNHHIKVLGRHGVMDLAIIGNPEEMTSAVSQVRSLLSGMEFVQGRRYEEFIKGDKVAAVGLTGLIVGGAAVAAAKSGLLAKLFKPLLIGLMMALAGIARWFKSIVARLFGRGGEGQG